MFKLAVLPGDGIGPEVTDQALAVLQAVAGKHGLKLVIEKGLIGGQAYDATGSPFPPETEELAKASDAILLGAVGGAKWDELPVSKRPEQGLLAIRKTLGLYANLRPVQCWPQLVDQSPFKRETINGVDLLIVRELIGGAYFGARGTKTHGDEVSAFDTIEYSESEIRRIVSVAAGLALKRRKKITSVDKANVLDTSRLWRKTFEDEIRKYPELDYNHLYVDNCAMQLCKKPSQFDVIVTENMFGDILSDQASVLGASLGMLPSASIGESAALYEPAHGSVPGSVGLDRVNPLAAILSVAMMLRITLGQEKAASDVEDAVNRVLDKGLRTADIYSPGMERIGTRAMGEAVVKEIVA